jgi:hypothetical protein
MVLMAILPGGVIGDARRPFSGTRIAVNIARR